MNSQRNDIIVPVNELSLTQSCGHKNQFACTTTQITTKRVTSTFESLKTLSGQRFQTQRYVSSFLKVLASVIRQQILQLQ